MESVIQVTQVVQGLLEKHLVQALLVTLDLQVKWVIQGLLEKHLVQALLVQQVK
jgi:hypothetical protein